MSQMLQADFCELRSEGLIAVSGEDAASFLHSQLTSDVAGLVESRTQYSGYCSPKGRLLATFLLWRTPAGVLLQLAADLRESVQERLSKYVLRTRVRLSDASARYLMFGLAGDHAASVLAEINLPVPSADHEITAAGDVFVTRLPVNRYALVADADRGVSLRASLEKHARSRDATLWEQLNIEAGIPVITSQTQDQHVPQMVNLDLIGAVSYSKGCYPGQEIVARMHYLGRLKQRMYRVCVPTLEPIHAGDSLFSAQFGHEQASGSILQATRRDNATFEALAVIKTASVQAGAVH
ncbi:MAG: CAF17-like 4Fe-4S cluster assembly/insertion protein YgfZ, partial [Burkholderiales bacterium]